MKLIPNVVPVQFSYFLYRNKDSKVELSIQCWLILLFAVFKIEFKQHVKSRMLKSKLLYLDSNVVSSCFLVVDFGALKFLEFLYHRY